jgi:predicted ATPase/DNA-binding winged helix-turn-helix (wHTH) protein
VIATLRFGRFELRPASRQLLVDARPVALGARAFDVLQALVDSRERVVTKEELLDLAWPGLVVEEANLQVQVSALRKILGRDAIATIPRRGYRFTLGVTDESVTPKATPKYNLPQQLTRFIGREKEIAEVRTLLDKTRLLTLTGSGGCGKTRLSLQVAAGLLKSYADGVWLVELAAVTDPHLVPQTVATGLGLKEELNRSLTQTLTVHLKSKHLLLLLDNAEHLLAACAQLAEVVLTQCAQVTMLVTSREALGIAGELTYRVPPLSMPDPKRDATPESLAKYESAQLFIERALFRMPQFAVNRENAPALAALCYRLDGIPLAIELAAARVRSMSPEELNQRLDHRFGLLTGGSRTALPRQQTLRSAIDWSYDLLNDAEQALFRRLSVFAAGWTLGAVQAFSAGPSIDEDTVLDLLTSLVEKSLVVAEERKGATRYWLLETMRAYARDRLRESGEEAEWQSRHLAYFVALAEEAEPQLTGADQEAWLDRLETEHDNLRSALAWSSTAGGDRAGGVRLAGALSWFWYVRGYLGEGRGWLSGSLAAAGDGLPAASRAKALHGAGVLASEQGDYSAARALHWESLAIRRVLGDRRGIAVSLSNLGVMAEEQSDYAAARVLRQESLALFRELGDQRGVAALLNNLGVVADEQGDYAAARALHEESLAIRRHLGDRMGIAISLNNLGLVARGQGEYAGAHELHGEALAIRCELGDRRGIAASLEGLANVAFALAKPYRAARCWGAAERLREEIGAPLPLSERARYDNQVAAGRAASNDDPAFELAWREGRAMSLEQAIVFALRTHDA